ncbi:flippase-like domain-containing protein [Rossellomorea sp. SC111]|uniref:lysylphosphatidylglycerol synthase transmembrane domain-containing protein n=1 Tax=Rossellomorea sp. SC111 TaxID=2968985 RepID=UPI00215A4A52|nr:flippase-like domain-containing protein [Rossellomorea sp. SC111]MCR8850998.1 flippase-like domain-containing protein [Rossellomorea sp. SC111]
MNKRIYKFAKNVVRLVLLGLFFILVTFYFDKEYMINAIEQMLDHPFILFSVLGIYFLSFLLKGMAWKVYLNEHVRLSSCLIGLFYSLLFNHLFPLKVGDGLRVMVMNQREKQISVARSFHSVFVLRVMDILFLMFLAGIGLLYFPLPLKLPGLYSIGLAGCSVLIGVLLLWYFASDFLSRQLSMLKRALSGRRGLMVITLVFMSWILEGAILYGVSIIMLEPLSMGKAIWINSVTIIGQLFQFAPGGLGTYESVMSYTLLSAGIPLGIGLSMAILSHGLKFIFSFIAGGIVIAVSPVSIKNVKQWSRMKG